MTYVEQTLNGILTGARKRKNDDEDRLKDDRTKNVKNSLAEGWNKIDQTRKYRKRRLSGTGYRFCGVLLCELRN